MYCENVKYTMKHGEARFISDKELKRLSKDERNRVFKWSEPEKTVPMVNMKVMRDKIKEVWTLIQELKVHKSHEEVTTHIKNHYSTWFKNHPTIFKKMLNSKTTNKEISVLIELTHICDKCKDFEEGKKKAADVIVKNFLVNEKDF
jgi:hypothetical protein